MGHFLGARYRNDPIVWVLGYGLAQHLHTTDTADFQTYTPPASGRGEDWVLILEDADAGFSMPGRSA